MFNFIHFLKHLLFTSIKKSDLPLPQPYKLIKQLHTTFSTTFSPLSSSITTSQNHPPHHRYLFSLSFPLPQIHTPKTLTASLILHELHLSHPNSNLDIHSLSCNVVLAAAQNPILGNRTYVVADVLLRNQIHHESVIILKHIQHMNHSRIFFLCSVIV